MSGDERNTELLESLSNGLMLLKLFGAGIQSLTIQDVATRLDVTRAAARRLLLTLEHHGYVAEHGRAYSITPRVIELGYSYFAGAKLTTLTKAPMRDLAAHVKETCSLGVLDGPYVTMIAREEPERLLRLDLAVGRRLPAYAHSLGRQLLAYLDEPAWEQYVSSADIRKFTPLTVSSKTALERSFTRIRQDGYCVVMDEILEGVGGISVPLRDRTGVVVAAMSVSMVLGKRTREAMVEDFLGPLDQAAKSIESMLNTMQ